MTRHPVPRIEKGGGTVPVAVRAEISQVLLTEDAIARRVRQLAAEIQADFAKKDLVVVALLNGTVMFLADLVRQIHLPLRLDFMGVSSYRGGASPKEIVYTKELKIDVKGRDVLVVDDILDTGRTLEAVIARLKPLEPRRIRSCVLLDKPARRVLKLRADYTGFRIADHFVVGYGLDYAERFRHLPFIGALKPEVYEAK